MIELVPLRKKVLSKGQSRSHRTTQAHVNLTPLEHERWKRTARRNGFPSLSAQIRAAMAPKVERYFPPEKVKKG